MAADDCLFFLHASIYFGAPTPLNEHETPQNIYFFTSSEKQKHILANLKRSLPKLNVCLQLHFVVMSNLRSC